MCAIIFTLEPTVIFILYVKKMKKKRFTRYEDINLLNVINK